jgi:succinoglycan biosynthesis protein ExoA
MRPPNYPTQRLDAGIPVAARRLSAQAVKGLGALGEERSFGPPERRALIVVPCLNEEAFIGPLLVQLLADNDLEDPLIVVADGGSSDRTRDIVGELASRDCRVKLIANPKRLQSAGVNLAARLFGQGRAWLVRIDAHSTYPDRYASRLIAEGLRTQADSVVVPMDARGADGFQRAAATAQTSRLGTGGSAHRMEGATGWVDHGHHALFRLQPFLSCGGYDETFSHNEDAEFDLRLAKSGGKIWLTDAVRLVYHPRGTMGALWRQYMAYGRGRARTVLKHRARLRIRQALPLVVAPAVLMALAAPFIAVAALPALAWALLCLGYGAVLGVRQRNGWAMLAGLAAMEMHLAWCVGFWREVIGQKLRRRPVCRSLKAEASGIGH